MTFLRRSDLALGLLISLAVGYLWMAYETGLERHAGCDSAAGESVPGGAVARILDGLDWPLGASGQGRDVCRGDTASGHAGPLPPKTLDRIAPGSPAPAQPSDALPPKLEDRIAPQGVAPAPPASVPAGFRRPA